MDGVSVRALRVVWWVTVVGVVVLAAAFATRLPEAGGALAFGTAVGFVAAAASLLAGGPEDPVRDRLVRATRRAAAATVASATVLVLGVAVGPAVVLPLGVLGLLSPPVVGRLGLPEPEGQAAPACETAEDESARLSLHLVRERLAGLELGEVSQLWRRSGSRLRVERDGREIGWLVLLRQLLIDELDRRDPEALCRWLDSDPRAADDPTTYFQQQEPPESLAS